MFEFQSLRTSRYRMARNSLDRERVKAFEADYRRKAQPKFDRFGTVGLTSGALFGMGIRSRMGG